MPCNAGDIVFKLRSRGEMTSQHFLLPAFLPNNLDVMLILHRKLIHLSQFLD